MRPYILLFFLILSSLFLLSCEKRAVDNEQVSPEERIVIKFSHVVSESSPKGLAAKRFAQLVNQRSDGRVEVQVYANSQLYKDGEEIAALQAGNIQLIAPATAKMTKYFPQLIIFDMPFLFSSYQHVYETVDGPVGQELLSQMSGQEMLGLALWDNGFKQIAAKQPVVTKGDFSGMRFRVMDSQLLVDKFRGVGSYTLVLPFSEVYAAVEQQEADGIENSLSNIYTKRFHNVLPYITISNHGYLGYVVLTNADFWNSLPDDLREIIEEALQEVTLWQREVAMEQNQYSLEQIIKSQGEKVIFLPEEQREEWNSAFVHVYRKYQHLVGDLINKISN